MPDKFDDHKPIPVTHSRMPISLCQICLEKIRRKGDEWEHFGIDVPYEKQTYNA